MGILFFVSLILLLVPQDPVYAQNLQLKYVQIVFRHGARSPIKFYPNDPNNSKWPQGLGQLTTLGMQQHYQLGGWLAARYRNFLAPQYVRTDVYYRSDDEDRTLMSAESQLASLFTPTGAQQFNASLNWQPIPVHTIAISQDALLNFPPCPVYDAMFNSVMSSSEIQAVAQAYDPLFKYLSANSGANVNINTFDVVEDPATSERAHNMPQPVWFNDTVYQQLSTVNNLSWHWDFYNRTLTRLMAGVLVNTLIKNMGIAQQLDGLPPNSTVNLTSSLQPLLASRGNKLTAFSGHDTNIAALQHAIGAWNGLAPPFASCMLFELSKDITTGTWYVSVLLRNTSLADAYPLVVAGCTNPCPLEKFTQLLADVNMPYEQRATECGLSTTAPPSTTMTTAAATSTQSATTVATDIQPQSPPPCHPVNNTQIVIVERQGSQYVLTLTMTPTLWLCAIAVLALLLVCFLSFISYISYLLCCKKRRVAKRVEKQQAASLRRRSSNKYNAERLLRDADVNDADY